MSDLYYDPWNVDIDVDPYPTYQRLRSEAPVYHHEQYNFWAISRYDDVEAALRDSRRLSSAKGNILEMVITEPVMSPGVFINEDPPLHDIHRNLLGGIFSPERVAALEAQVRAWCAERLDAVMGGDQFDFVEDLGVDLPMHTISTLVGVPEAAQVAVYTRTYEVLRNTAGEPLSVNMDRYLDCSLFADYVAWRRKNPADDPVTQLLAAEFEDHTGARRSLRTEELLMMISVVVGAGVGTSSRLFGWMGMVLGDHPDQLRELAEDPSLIGPAIEELLRFEPPGPHVARYVTAEDVVFADEKIPAGSALLVLLASANHDERRFADPDTFDIHRRDIAHLTFGRGTHSCLGAGLARLQARVALEEILKRFPSWKIDRDSARRSATSVARGWDKMPALIC